MPLTLDQLIGHLIEFRAAYPDQGHRPVHPLDLALDDGDGLVRAVELDCSGEQRGPVISLLSGPMPEIRPCGAALSGPLGGAGGTNHPARGEVSVPAPHWGVMARGQLQLTIIDGLPAPRSAACRRAARTRSPLCSLSNRAHAHGVR